ncbi:hypothetical protein [Streptomyces sp. HC307]|uniref:hypothetical protein n=1 Tax=Streptomyces flavusporus TaxID=3385496 RepID=UPI0039176014
MNSTLRKGEQIGILTAPSGIKTEEESIIEKTMEVIDEETTLREVLRSEEVMQELATELSLLVKGPGGILPAGEVGGKIKSSVQAKLSDSMKEALGHRSGTTRKEKFSRRRNVQHTGGTGDKYVVPFYQERYYDLSLEFIDYLGIRYSKSPLAVYYRRAKQPEHTKYGMAGNSWKKTGPNIVAVHKSVASVTMWRLIADEYSFPAIVPANEYTLEVEHPNDIKFSPPDTAKTGGFRRTAECRSLYDLSEQVFPPKVRFDRYDEQMLR